MKKPKKKIPQKRATAAQKEKRIGLAMSLLAIGKDASIIIEHLVKTEGLSKRQAQRYCADGQKALIQLGEKTPTEILGMIFKRNELFHQQAMNQKDLKATGMAIKNDIHLLQVIKRDHQYTGGISKHDSAPSETISPSSELEELFGSFATEENAPDDKTLG